MEQPVDSPRKGWRDRLSQAQQAATNSAVIVVALAKIVDEYRRMIR